MNHFRISSVPVLVPWALARDAWTGLLLLALLLGCLPGSAHATDAGQPAAAFTHVMVELALPPAAALFAQANAAGQDRATMAVATRAHLTRIDAAQTVVLANLPPDAAVLYQVRNAYNGIAIRINAEEIAQLAELPGVAAIHPLIPKQPDNVQSVPFTGAPVLWRGLTDDLGDDITGRGMTIAVIDTGVDYLHATFGGVGPYTAAYAENDPTRIGDVPGFPGAKVISGYDFAGDAYNADPDAADYMPFPQPDQDPMDCYPHGTHVAATAAGYGVLSSGRTDERVYRGPYDPTTYQQNFAIGPGVAPHASIIALKVFGCRGSSDLVELAIDWAIDPNGDGDFSDRVDVINLSLGSSYGAVHDPAAIAANNAALAGIVVVASTGNAGDVVYITGSPAVADRVISVAAGRVPVSGAAPAAGAQTHAEASSNIGAFSSRGPRRDDSSLKPDIMAPGVNILSAVPGGSGVRGEAWSGTSMASPHVAGAMALLRQLHPTWSVEELKALVMNSAQLASAAAMTTASPTRIGAGELDLSQVTANETVAFDADGSGRVSLSFGAPEVRTELSRVRQVRVINRGPVTVTYTLDYAPAIDMPGVEIGPEETRLTVPPGGAALMPIRMDAEAEAMRRVRDPGMSATQGYPRHWLPEESGQLWLWPHTVNEEPAWRADLHLAAIPTSAMVGQGRFFFEPASRVLSYTVGLDHQPITASMALAIRRDRADGPLAYRLPTPDEVDAQGALHGAVTLAESDAMRLLTGRLFLQVVQTGTQTLTLSGQIATATPVLHLPVSAAPRPVAEMHAAPVMLTFGPGSAAVQTLPLIGTALEQPSPPMGSRSLVSVFELQFESLNARPGTPAQSQVDIFDHADIRAVGIASHGRVEPDNANAQETIYFGVATYADWASPNEVEINIYIDSNRDGADDYRLFNSDAIGYDSASETGDGFVAVVEELATGDVEARQFLNIVSPGDADTALFNSNVMVLPVAPAAIGLADGHSNFLYRVETYSRARREPVDTTPTLAYDMRDVNLDLFHGNSATPIMEERPGTEITVGYNLQNAQRNGERGLLLFHHHNQGGQRVEIIAVRYAWPVEIFVPLVTNARNENR